MASTKYYYSISEDTAAAKLASSKLATEIASSSIVTALDYIESTGDVLDIWMKDVLSAGDQTTLGTVVNAHDGIPDPSNEPHDNDNAPIVRLRAFANTDGIFFRGTGIKGTATKNSSTNFNYDMTEDRYINGVEFFVKNQEWGDTVKLQVVDKDGAVYPAGTVLDEFGTDWHIASDSERQGPYILPYPALVQSIFWIRIVYNSTGVTNDVDFKANLFLHKKP